jgi:hypothetical protein
MGKAEQELEFEQKSLRAQDLIRANALDEAEKLLQAIPRGPRFEGWFHERTIAVIRLAERLAARGDRMRATRLLSEASIDSEALTEGSTWEPAECFMWIGQALAQVGLTAEALTALNRAGSIALERQRTDIDCGKILVRLSEILAENGVPDEAESLARRIDLGSLRSEALSRIQDRAKKEEGSR